MIDCLVIGDSIAVGTHQQRTECASYSKGGINSWQWNKQYGQNDLTAKTVIISLGSNDHKYIKTYDELQKLRSKIKASRVFWILPAGNLKASEVDIEAIRILIREIAVHNGDVVLPITKVSKDGIHPTGAGYRELANQTKEK
jgi:lysophospholipase L1-like esterase